MARVLIISGLVCIVGAISEGVFAGTGVKARLASLRMPRGAPPFSAWIFIGVLYYAICFAVCTRLLLLPSSTTRSAAFGLLGALMFINALWNYFFFRTRNLFHAYLISLPYALIALGLFLLLFRLDGTAAFCLVPYLLYLFYAGTFGYRVWKLNSP